MLNAGTKSGTATKSKAPALPTMPKSILGMEAN